MAERIKILDSPDVGWDDVILDPSWPQGGGTVVESGPYDRFGRVIPLNISERGFEFISAPEAPGGTAIAVNGHRLVPLRDRPIHQCSRCGFEIQDEAMNLGLRRQNIAPCEGENPTV